MLPREQLMELARKVYRSYGFVPIDTPALEYSEVLLGKGGEESDKQVFRFMDQGDRDVAMRFDLTVPFARFAAQHIGTLGTPFKRYHIGTVWRGERPARGRYREFVQCDFDTIGTTSNAADIETLLVINDLMEQIGFENFTIFVNHRQVLNGLLETFGLGDRISEVLRILDKINKIGQDKVRTELQQTCGVSPEQATQVTDISLEVGKFEPIARHLEKQLNQNEAALDAIGNLRELFGVAKKVGLPEDRVQLDLSIARGLDYYTGTIYETFLGDLPQIGSVCSGGRYDNLAGLFTKEKLPGIGASLGLDRLLAAMEELGILGGTTTSAQVLITQFDRQYLGQYYALAKVIRDAGVACEVYPDAKAIGKQFKYADRKGFQYVIIAGQSEIEAKEWQLKDLSSGEQISLSQTDLIERLLPLSEATTS